LPVEREKRETGEDSDSEREYWNLGVKDRKAGEGKDKRENEWLCDIKGEKGATSTTGRRGGR